MFVPINIYFLITIKGCGNDVVENTEDCDDNIDIMCSPYCINCTTNPSHCSCVANFSDIGILNIILLLILY